MASRASRSTRAAGSSPAAERSDRCACGASRISGRPFRRSQATAAPSPGLAFDPTGSFLATTSLFGATRLWDPATGLGYGDELAGSPKPGSLEPSIDLPFLGLRNAFSPDGTLLVATGVDTRTMLWDVDPAVWRRRACAIVGRNLSREEWALYLPPGTPYRATCSQWPAD